MDRGAWRATPHGVTHSQVRLSVRTQHSQPHAGLSRSVISTPPTPRAVSAVCVSVSVSIKVSSWERAICPLQCRPAPEAGFGEAGPPLWAGRAWGGCSPCYPPLSKWELGGSHREAGGSEPWSGRHLHTQAFWDDNVGGAAGSGCAPCPVGRRGPAFPRHPLGPVTHHCSSSDSATCHGHMPTQNP